MNSSKEQARNNFRFLGDWAPEETAITRHVLWTSINLGSVIFGLQRKQLKDIKSPSLTLTSVGFEKPEVILGLFLS